MLQNIQQHPTLGPVLKTGEQLLPKAVVTLLVICSIWMSAGVIWALIPHPEISSPPLKKVNTASNNKTVVDVRSLRDLNLFGKIASKPKGEPKTSNVDAPETRLNLVLAGIILSENETLSRALIANSNGKQKNYAAGSTIDGSNAVIDEIHAEHVVLERSGRYEILRLLKPTNNISQNNNKNNSRSSRKPNVEEGNVAGQLKSVREQILKDPSKAADFIRVRPVYSKGKLSGYRIYPGKDRALYRKVGLRSGDLVTSINGQSLNDPQKAFSMLSTLSSATTITLELQRRGRTENVSVDLSQ